MQAPRENPEDKKARERERRLAEIEQRRAASQNAASLTGDIRRSFMPSLFNIPRSS